jgi:CelD/BcsL family acetyltransferase involved in cellulose biosynthesis
VLRLHTARQEQLTARGRSRELIAQKAEHRAAIIAVLRYAAAHDSARHHLLYADGRLAAFVLTLVVGDTVLTWPTAIDEEFASYGPGTLVFWEAVCSEFARGGVRRMDFGPGTTTVKEFVSTHSLAPIRMKWDPTDSLLSTFRVRGYSALVRLRARLG